MKNKLTKRVLTVLSLVFLSLLLSGCFGGDSTGETDSTAAPVSVKTSAPKQTEPIENLVINPLSGEPVPEGTTDRRPLAVMIENSPAARPQSGLGKAEIVYEILAEGGLTRFLAIYLAGDTDMLGPVRSARPYFIERMFEYQAMYAFCGGSPAALKMVKTERVASLDEFGVGRKAYFRIKSRKAPHNLYADTVKLRQVGAKKGYEKQVKLPEFEFLEKGEENPGGITSTNIKINYPTRYSKVNWEYDSGLKQYKRSEGGSVHRDAVTGKQLTGSNIIVQYVKTSIIDKEGRLEFPMVGRGRALMFTEGKSYSGKWVKSGTRSQTYFYLDNGEVFKLNPGQTWIQVVPSSTKVEY